MEISFLEQFKSSKDNESKWFHICTSKNIPMVKTERRCEFGDVDWDYITVDPKDDAFLFEEQEFIISELQDLLNFYTVPKTIQHIGARTGYVKNLPVEYVSAFAQDVCNTLMSAYTRYERLKSS
ncbi:hypothetical protein [Methylophaga nitratireducenticrescens]|uniref:hypothetical protein n=1 Tax=Methylophaga nitratireducenticrescens TaxID=754476 RepID=UPI00059D7F37|nr:hypothetical protein [Methylophaga nitratireducenticrescens]ASF49080.1 hypothetical protein Q7A_03335 [Methylophaga nitratireducenticrescens]AUZ83812.1 hypothetical protein CDW43_04155 [Methylophaga nitratireducenticrescens]